MSKFALKMEVLLVYRQSIKMGYFSHILKLTLQFVMILSGVMSLLDFGRLAQILRFLRLRL